MAFILSTLFILLTLAFSGDLIAIQAIYSELDARALNVSHLISINGGPTAAVLSYAETNGVSFVSISTAVRVGEPFEYRLEKYYDPMFMDDEPILVSIRRAAVVGYY